MYEARCTVFYADGLARANFEYDFFKVYQLITGVNNVHTLAIYMFNVVFVHSQMINNIKVFGLLVM